MRNFSFFCYFLRVFLYKIIIQICKIFKNKTLDVKTILKTYSKLLKIN